MVRIFGTSVILAICIAILLSYIPIVDVVKRDQGITVFKDDELIQLSDATLVDWLSNIQPPFPYARVEWNEYSQSLAINFVAHTRPSTQAIEDGLLVFARYTFSSTENIQTLISQLFDINGELLASLVLDRNSLIDNSVTLETIREALQLQTP